MRYAIGLTFLALLGFLLASGVPACSSEGEGQPCSTLGDNNGIDECQNGYECVSPRNGTIISNGNINGVCCPGDPALATQLICQQPSNPLPLDAGAMDTSVADVPATPESSPETSTESSTEGSTPDGSGDAPAEGG